jgi:hypothetical protein
MRGVPAALLDLGLLLCCVSQAREERENRVGKKVRGAAAALIYNDNSRSAWCRGALRVILPVAHGGKGALRLSGTTS